MNKKNIIIYISFLLLLSCSCQEKETQYVLFENDTAISFKIKKIDTIHSYSCKTEKASIEADIIFKICNEYFIKKNDTDLVLVTDSENYKILKIEEFLGEYQHLRGTEKIIYFLEKKTANSYLKHSVLWSKDFIEYEPSKREFEKF